MEEKTPYRVRPWQYVVSVLIPIVGIVLGIVACAKSKVGPGIALFATSIVAGIVTVAIMAGTSETESTFAQNSDAAGTEQVVPAPAQEELAAETVEPAEETSESTEDWLEDASDAVEEPEPVEPAEPTMTPGQENALESAQSYLDGQAFSKSGLIEQLKFEGYSSDDARFAVKNVDVSWKEQAALSAESYLESQSFSRQGLLEQLVFEGFSQAQADYGVSQAY